MWLFGGMRDGIGRVILLGDDYGALNLFLNRGFACWDNSSRDAFTVGVIYTNTIHQFELLEF